MLPEGSAYDRSVTEGHSSIHELLAQIRDAVNVTAHNRKWEGEPKPYLRPGQRSGPRHLSLSDPGDRAALRGFLNTS